MAEADFQQVLAIRRKAGGTENLAYASALDDLVRLHQREEKIPGPSRIAAKRSRYRERLLGRQHPDYADSVMTLAGLHEAMGDYARAEPLYRQAIDIRKQALGERDPNYAASLNSLAMLYETVGDYARALPLCRQALEIRRQALRRAASRLCQQPAPPGRALSGAGGWPRAEPLYRQSLEILKAVSGERDPDYASGLNNLALLYSDRGDYARAEPLFLQVLEIRKQAQGEQHPAYAKALNNLAVLYQTMGDYARAEPLFRQALDIRKEQLGEKHPDYAVRLNNLAALYWLMRDDARAEQLAAQAVLIEQQNLAQTADALSTRQQLAMLSTVRRFLDALLSVTEKTGHHQLAWQHVLAWKGSVAGRQRAMHALASRPDLAPRWAELQSATAALARQSRAIPEPAGAEAWRHSTAELSQRVEGLQRNLAAQSAGYRRTREPATAERVRAALPADAVLVDFLEYSQSEPTDKPGKLRFDRRLVAFVVRRSGPIQRFELGPIKPINAAIDSSRSELGRGPGRLGCGGNLARKALGTVGSEPDGRENDHRLARRRLGKLPLAALPGEDPTHCLIEDFPIAIVGAPQELVWLQEEPPKRPRAGNMLVLGDVDYEARRQSELGAAPPRIFTSWPAVIAGRRARQSRRFDLHATARHQGRSCHDRKIVCRRVRRHGPDYAGKGAGHRGGLPPGGTRLRLSAPGHARILRAARGQVGARPRAGHAREGAEGLVSTQSLSGYHPGLLSGLVLAGANQPTEDDDGILTAEDVEALDLSGIRLVVLSACDTGLGQVAGGEGLLGLQRAFAAAGADRDRQPVEG